MSSTDLTLIERLRKENLEQFLVLVRMHLSFVVDINTDDVDSSTDKPKQFRWNFHRKSKNTASNSTPSGSNAKSVQENTTITEEGMSRVYELIDFLSKEENVKQEGVFRRTGSLNRQQELRQLLLTGSGLGLDEGRFSVHDCASVLKGFLAELSQPLLMDQYYQTYCTLAAQYPPQAESSEGKLLIALQLLLLLLTPLHRSFLRRLLALLKVAADHQTSNRMSPDTLATMFTPHLLCPRKLSPETFHADSLALAPVVSFMIRQSARLFDAPAQLATDVAAYFTIRERKRMMSPDIDLDESITDRTAASTVYTFVRRPCGPAPAPRDHTDAALAQLYAHIQALPDSQHKRRLVKQFNRQNGYGTPIQVQRTGKVAGSRSFGDSIKRHIFNKGLLNKTPKKTGSGSVFHTVDEKSSPSLNKDKTKLSNEDNTKTCEVSHRNIVLKNLATKMASTESMNGDDFDSDASNESTISESGLLNRERKHSPKFVSEPNLSVIDSRMNDETPKIVKKGASRLFRSKILSASQNINKKYQKRRVPIRSTPTCVSCLDEQDTGSENDNSFPKVKQNDKENCVKKTPTKMNVAPDVSVKRNASEKDLLRVGKINYLTSTPGIETTVFDEELCSTPYTMNFRRASMSPITKSTQKLSKAMQESIMTPRSRKPLIITSEQGTRDSMPDNAQKHLENSSKSCETIYQSLSPKNDSDFVSSDDEIMHSKSSLHSYEHNSSLSVVRSESTRFVISNNTRSHLVEEDLNTTLCGGEDGLLLPKFKISHEVSEFPQKTKSLSEPFREYLLSRSVLTATPVDLSLLNKSNDTEERISDSLMYCLDGNVPSDLTSSISNLAVDKTVDSVLRSPLKSLNTKSPNRKRGASSKLDDVEVETKKIMVEKENVINIDNNYKLRETDL